MPRTSDAPSASGSRRRSARSWAGTAELDTLLAALTQAGEGPGALAIVTGAAGLGKTRLLGELCARAAGARTLRVQCSQAGGHHPYAAAGAIVRRALHLDLHTPEAEVARRLRTVVRERAPGLAPWLPLLGLVVGIALEGTPETAALEESFVSERIATSVDELLTSIVPDEALVVVDDAHLLDEASAALIGYLAAGIRSRRWLLVLAHRGPGDGFVAPEGVEALTVPLAPLEHSAALLLAVQLTEDAPLPQHVAVAVATRSDGSPLFVTEMVAAMRAGADHHTLPESVEALMALQIDELASADRAVLRQASVMGVRFTRAALVAALELDDDAADAVLGRLEGFLVAEEGGALLFRHGLLRDAAYHGLSFRRRRVLHRRVGEAMELAAGRRRLGGRSRPDPPFLRIRRVGEVAPLRPARRLDGARGLCERRCRGRARAGRRGRREAAGCAARGRDAGGGGARRRAPVARRVRECAGGLRASPGAASGATRSSAPGCCARRRSSPTGSASSPRRCGS